MIPMTTALTSRCPSAPGPLHFFVLQILQYLAPLQLMLLFLQYRPQRLRGG